MTTPFNVTPFNLTMTKEEICIASQYGVGDGYYGNGHLSIDALPDGGASLSDQEALRLWRPA